MLGFIDVHPVLTVILLIVGSVAVADIVRAARSK